MGNAGVAARTAELSGRCRAPGIIEVGVRPCWVSAVNCTGINIYRYAPAVLALWFGSDIRIKNSVEMKVIINTNWQCAEHSE